MSIIFSNINKHSREKLKVISVALYGDKPKYTFGLIANLILRPIYYPDFCTFIYFDDTVPSYIIENCKRFDEVMLINMTSVENIPKMMWRFIPCDTDNDVEYFISRDCDSRLTHREAEAVYAWIKGGKTLHVMRDHPCHYQYAIYGGMFGLRNIKLKDEIETWVKQKKETSGKETNEYGNDCLFLSYVVFEKFKNDVIIHDSLNLYNTQFTYPFPSRMNVDMNFVGETINITRVDKEVKMLEKYKGRV